MTDGNVGLSEREIEILRLVATGASNKDIALTLQISTNTVKVHLRNIFAKIGVVSRTEATLYALRNGLAVDSGGGIQAGETQSGDDAAEPLAAEADKQPPARRGGWLRMLLLAGAALVLLGLGVWLVQRLAAPAPIVQPAPDPQRWQSQPMTGGEAAEAWGVSYAGGIYLFGEGGGWRYLAEKESWEALPPRNEALRGTEGARIGSVVYLVGGETQDGVAQAALVAFRLEENSWKELKPLPVPLNGAAVAGLDGLLYVMGGRNGTEFSTRLLIYDPQEDRWREGKDLPVALADGAAVSLEGRIRLIGGEGAKGALKGVWDYLPESDSWQRGPGLERALARPAAVTLANIIYVFDASGESRAGWGIEAGGERWFTVDPPPQAVQRGGAAVAAGNYIHLMDGENHQVYQAIYTINLPLSGN